MRRTLRVFLAMNLIIGDETITERGMDFIILEMEQD